MAEQETPQPPAPPREKKLLGLPMPVAIGGLAFVGVLGYVWWRNHKMATAAAGGGGGVTGATTSTTFVKGPSDAGQLDAIQAELEQLIDLQGRKREDQDKDDKKTKEDNDKDDKKPGVPTGLRAEDVDQRSATLVCNKVAGKGVRYDFDVRAPHPSKAETEGESIHGGTSSEPRRNLSGLKPSTRYTWKVRAIDEGGEGPWSRTAEFTTKFGGGR